MTSYSEMCAIFEGFAEAEVAIKYTVEHSINHYPNVRMRIALHDTCLWNYITYEPV
jgi:hypothetical protein